MKNQKNDQNSQSTVSEKSGKHDANLQQNSTLYFQIGLIVCLLGAYIALEHNFEQYNIPTVALIQDCDDDDDTMYVPTKFTVIKDVAMNEPKKANPTVLIDPEIIENDDQDKPETDNIVDVLVKVVNKGTKVKSLDPNDLDIPPVEQPVVIPVAFVENVPVYPGCEKASNNKQRVKCMSDKLTKLVQRKFDTDIAADEGLEGRQKIYVQFKIKKNGEIQLVNSRAPHIALENEAARITSKIPKMKPGSQNGKPVAVLYTLPIIFDVQ
ncbi:energy transducer TonB [Aurantibacter sp.]|uniref:energy transducer TonB n=1 Tax=Aurantibacter sp. TaxID=2807103 RepID=UPI0035C82EE6